MSDEGSSIVVGQPEPSKPNPTRASALAKPRQRLGDVRSALHDFAITTFDVDADTLDALLPAPLVSERVRLDDGRERALASAVSFRNVDFAVGFAPFVRISATQVNYRVYVLGPEGRAVYFFGTSLGSPFVAIPRHVFRMPWRYARQRVEATFDAARLLSYRWEGRGALGEERLLARGTGEPMGRLDGFSDAATTEEMLTDPRIGYLRRSGLSVGRYTVWHAPLGLERAAAEEARFELYERLGLVTPNQAPHSVLVMPRTEYLIQLPPPRRSLARHHGRDYAGGMNAEPPFFLGMAPRFCRGRALRLAAFASLITLAGILAVPSSAHAQGTDANYQQWVSGTFTGRLRETRETPLVPLLWLDVHARRAPGQTVAIFRPAIGLMLAPSVSVYAGYAWIPTFFDGVSRFDEHRFWQQIILSYSGDGIALQSRTRTEIRFGENSDDVGFRFRQFVRFGFRPEDAPIGFVVWDEIFLGLKDTDWGNVAGYDQNRLFLGAQFPGDGWGRVEAGYLFVHLNRAPNDRIAHVLAVNLFFSYGR